MTALDWALSGGRACPLCGWGLYPQDGHEAGRDVYGAAEALSAHDARFHGGAVAGWLRLVE